MEKYKVCPCCGEHNQPMMVECLKCETDLSGVKVVDQETEQNQNACDSVSEPVKSTVMIRLCDCGFHNPVTARKCSSCGEEISDITPTEETTVSDESYHYVLTSIDGKYAYELTENSTVIGRECVMKEYLSSKSYVSRIHAELVIEDGLLYIINLSSTNFTYVNDTKIMEARTELRDGDEVGLGGKNINGSRQDEAAYFLVRTGTCM